MRLKRFYADNFRCLVNFELQLEPVQLLAGGNGAGKTAVFDAIEALRALVVEGTACADVFPAASRTAWDNRTDQKFELDVADQGGELYRYELVTQAARQGETQVKFESLSRGGKRLFRYAQDQVELFNDLRPGPGATCAVTGARSFLAAVDARPDNKILTAFKSWLEKTRTIQINPWDMSEQSEHEARFPAHRMENIADWIRHLQQEDPEAFQSAVRNVQGAFPELTALAAKKAGLQCREVFATLATPEGPRDLSLTSLSEGQRSLIALYLLLQAFLIPGCTLCLDEPDNFVALREIQPWLFSAIDAAESGGGQLIVASHHPELLNQLVARSAVILTRESGGPTRIKPFPESPIPPAELVASGWENA